MHSRYCSVLSEKEDARMMRPMTITVLEKSSKEALDDLNVLMRQLRKEQVNKKDGTLSELQDIVDAKNVWMIVAMDEGRIVGTGTLYALQKIGKRIGHVEDVVVHADYRGNGLGEKIMRHIIELAKQQKVTTLNLTSRPGRSAANKLYQKVGFKLKETNPYRLEP